LFRTKQLNPCDFVFIDCVHFFVYSFAVLFAFLRFLPRKGLGR
jgi:hypothetical protein